MPNDLKPPYDLNDPQLGPVLDELPLWSAPFGVMLLDKIRMRPNLKVLDIGCGMGFPLIELAQRLGESCAVYGIDPWPLALERICLKNKSLRLTNLVAVKGEAEELPFRDGFFDLIVSNNGINNVRDPRKALAECRRTSRAGAQLVLTVNLPETMREFYDIFEETLRELGREPEIKKMREHIFAKRKPLEWTNNLLEESGFEVRDIARDSFTLRYLDGSTMFSHFFIKMYFFPSWKDIVAPAARDEVFTRLEMKLNKLAQDREELALTIPLACFDCRRK